MTGYECNTAVWEFVRVVQYLFVEAYDLHATHTVNLLLPQRGLQSSALFNYPPTWITASRYSAS